MVPDSVVARFQFFLSVLWVTGYFVVLGMLVTGFANPDPRFDTTVNTLMGVLTASTTLIMGYWFARQRSAGVSNETNS